MSKKRKGTDALPFKDILAAMMSERNLSIQQVAQLAGISKSVAQGWLSGATPHDLAAVSRLAKALGTSFKSLLLGESEEETGATSVAELFSEVELFEGLCRVSIRKLVPRGRP